MIPRYQQWAGTDCQGPALFNKRFGGAPGECQDQGDGTSWATTCDDIDGLTVRMFSASSHCQGTFEVRWNRVHTCFNTFPHSSEAYVCHNTSFTSIGAAAPGKPQPGDGTLKPGFQCTTASTCPPQMPYITFWSNNYCQGSPVSSKVIYGNLESNKCYYSEQQMNVKATCSNGNLRFSSYQSGCAGDAYFYEEVAVDSCITHGITGGSHKVYCGRN